MVTRVCHTCHPKMVGSLFAFGGKYDPLGLPLVTFLSVVEIFYSTNNVVIEALLCL